MNYGSSAATKSAGWGWGPQSFLGFTELRSNLVFKLSSSPVLLDRLERHGQIDDSVADDIHTEQGPAA